MAVNPFAVIAFAAIAGFALSRAGDDDEDDDQPDNNPDVGRDCGSQTPGYLQWDRLDGWGTDLASPPVLTLGLGDKVHVNLFGSTGPMVKFNEISVSEHARPQGGPEITPYPGPALEVDYWHGEPCPPTDNETPGILFITAKNLGGATVRIPGTDGSIHIANINVLPQPEQ